MYSHRRKLEGLQTLHLVEVGSLVLTSVHLTIDVSRTVSTSRSGSVDVFLNSTPFQRIPYHYRHTVSAPISTMTDEQVSVHE